MINEKRNLDNLFLSSLSDPTYGCRCQGFGSWGAAGIASVRRGMGLPHAGHGSSSTGFTLAFVLYNADAAVKRNNHK